jgi:hypothetical protein
MQQGPLLQLSGQLLADFVEEVCQQFEVDRAGNLPGHSLRSAEGLRLGEPSVPVSALPAFGGFGRLLREGTHRALHSVLLV